VRTGGGTDAEHVGSILRRLLKNFGLEKKIEEQEIALSWSKIVGEKLGKISRVKDVKDGVLFVEVKGSVWMSEISLLKPRLCDKLNEGRGSGTIRDIVLTQWRDRNEER
jgi:predicted nucleic acid-binding Zn ribbon protein